jgi:thiamine-monophosphate kinase
MQPTATMPNEFALIANHFAPLSRGFPGAYGLRDDAAVIAPSPGCELVVKTDAIIGSIDFPPDEPADLVARKALRVNLSDLAAKGAIPRAYLLDLMLPHPIDEVWIAAVAAGLAHDQAEYGVHLIGGDMSATPGPVTIAVTAIGETPMGRIIRRGGARAGDGIFVTGTIGDASLGFSVLRGRLPELSTEPAAFLIDRYRLPQPRATLGPRLIGVATAALDISDGLVADLRHLCDVSMLSAIIDSPGVPLSDAALAALAADPSMLTTVLTGGDDYEILFTAAPAEAGAIAELARTSGVPITLIGRMIAPSGEARCDVRVLGSDAQPMTLVSEGWTHF